MKNLTTKPLLILFLFFTNFFSIQAQTDWKTEEFWGELKGMTFKAKVDYKLDCAAATPFVRATLHSIEVMQFEYEGKTYKYEDIKGYKFPISIKKGFLTLDAEIYINENIIEGKHGTYHLNPTHLSTNNGGAGAAITADEFRFENQSDFTKHFNIKSCMDIKNKLQNNNLNVSLTILTKKVKKYDGNFEYNGSNLEQNLKYAIKKMKEEELARQNEKEIEDLKTEIDDRLNEYTKYSNGNSVEHYQKGLTEANSLLQNPKYTKIKSYIQNKKTNIRYALKQATEIKQMKEEIEAERKITENKRKNEEIRISKEDLERINRQIQYDNKVKFYQNKGIDLNNAHKFAQNDSKIQTIDEVGKVITNNLTNIVMDAINRKQERYENNARIIEAYRESFDVYCKKVSKADRRKKDKVKTLEFASKDLNSIEDTKQQLLWLLEYYLNGKRCEYYGGYSIIVKQELTDAYFKGNVLYLELKQSCQEADYDKDHLDTGYKHSPSQPSKYTLRLKYSYDFWIGKESEYMYIRCKWDNGGRINGNEQYFRTKLRNVNKYIYVIPKNYYPFSIRYLTSSKKYHLYRLIQEKKEKQKKIYLKYIRQVNELINENKMENALAIYRELKNTEFYSDNDIPQIKQLAEYELFAKAEKKQKADLYMEYINKYPNGKWLSNAKKELYEVLEAEADKARNSGNYKKAIKLYRDYLKIFPNDNRNDIILQKISNTETKLQKLKEKKEYDTYMYAKKHNYIQDYETYIKKYPNGKYAHEVNQILQNSYYKFGNDAYKAKNYRKAKSYYQIYISKYPNGPHSSDVRNKIGKCQNKLNQRNASFIMYSYDKESILGFSRGKLNKNKAAIYWNFKMNPAIFTGIDVLYTIDNQGQSDSPWDIAPTGKIRNANISFAMGITFKVAYPFWGYLGGGVGYFPQYVEVNEYKSNGSLYEKVWMKNTDETSADPFPEGGIYWKIGQALVLKYGIMYYKKPIHQFGFGIQL